MSKFKRKIVALTLAATMILTSLVGTAFANTDNSSTYNESANILKGYGVLIGDNGNLMLDEQLKRQDAVVIALRLMGVKDTEFENYDTLSDFTDITDEYYSPIIGMAQDLGLIEGMGDGTFGFDQMLTTQQLETILLRSLGYEITDDIYATVHELAAQVGIDNLISASPDEQITRDIVAQLMLNTLNTNVKDETQTLGEKLGITAPQAQTLEISSAKMVTDSSVKVTLNSAVTDTSKLAFELKSTTTVATTTTWNEAKTEATLTATAPLLDGTYTIKASGATFAAGKDLVTLVVAKNGPSKVEFTSDKLVKSSTDASQVIAHYKVLDAYGVDITKTTLASELSVAGSIGTKNVASFTIDTDGKGIMTLELGADLTDTDSKTGVVTIIASKNGAVGSGTATLTVSDKAQADVMTFKAVEYPKTSPITTKVLTGKSTAAYVPFEAKDQYGNIIEEAATVDGTADSDVVIAKSDSALTVTAEQYTPEGTTDKALRFVVDTSGISVAKIATVTVVSKLTGKSSSFTLDIKEPAKADKVSVGSPAKLVAASDVADSLVIPITALDQYGVQLTPDEIVTNATSSPAKITVTGTGALAGKIAIATTGVNKGKIVNNLALGAAEGTAVITVATSTSVATTTVDVQEAAYEYSIKVDKTPAANLLMGATTKMNYIFTDQYGREIKSPSGATDITLEVSNTAILKATIGASDTDGANPIVTKHAADIDAEDSVIITTNGTEGTAKVTAKLKKDGSVISTVDTSISVTSGVPSGLTFEIADFKTLAALNSGNVAVTGSDKYAQAIILTAKDANGTTYAIPSNRILSVTTTDTDLIQLSVATVDGDIKAQDGYYVVGAKDADTTSFAEVNAPATKTATIKVAISTDAGVREITKTVTLAKEQPKAVKVVFAYDSVNPGNAPVAIASDPYKLTTDAKEIVDISGTAATVKAQKIYVYEVDQYGVYSLIASPALTIVNMDKFTNGIILESNQLVFNAGQIKNEETVYLMYQATSGAYGTFSIKVTDGVTTLDTTAPVAGILANMTVAATTVTGNAGAVEGLATVKMVANNAAATAAAVGSGSVTALANGSFAAITGLTTGTNYDLYVFDAAGNVSAKLDILTA